MGEMTVLWAANRVRQLSTGALLIGMLLSCQGRGAPPSAAPPGAPQAPRPSTSESAQPAAAAPRAAPVPTSQANLMTNPAADPRATLLLQALAKDPAAHPTTEVSYQVGLETFRGGKTLVRLRGDGQATVSNQQGEALRTFTAVLSPTARQGFLVGLADHHFVALRSTRTTGEPGEARVQLRLQDPAAGLDVKVDLWDNERWKNNDLKAIVSAFQVLMKDVSKGAIKY